MNKKVTLITINSEQELTGGGHYLRCLINGYEKVTDELTIVSKFDNKANFSFQCNTLFTHLKKSFLPEIVSRLLLCPSFLLFYFPKIFKQCIQSDIIALHSSRLGMLSLFLSIAFPKKKIFCHFDNVEYLLLKSRVAKPSFTLKYIVNILDFILISMSEKLCVKFSDECSFITISDANYFDKNDFIIPICYEKSTSVELSNSSGDYYLFTASFDFEPNIDALNSFVEIANSHPSLKFVAAGRNLKIFNYDHVSNLTLIDSPTVSRMEDIFINAKGYISCVNFGSGMKTKVAEAMKYGLPVYATGNSLVGYEEILHKDYINNYTDLVHLSGLLKLNDGRVFDRQAIYRDFLNYYTTSRVELVLKRMFAC
ncbi:conserved hypothetical protein [Vibrio chagasii]|nr:conserved hypothetical protein [Vibrio chagasii]